MPRRRSGFSRSRNTSNTRNARTAPSPPRQSQAQSQGRSGGLFGSLMGTMFQGMAFGAGSEVAHQTLRGVMGGNQAHPQEQSQQNMQTQSEDQQQMQMGGCKMENSNFVECLKFNSNDISSCQQYLDALKMCESGSR